MSVTPALPDLGGDFDYPRGWFVVATSEQLKQGEPTSLLFMGRKFVGFRGEENQAIVMDAICLHMGADLAAGGCVEGNKIRCPFHGWQFDSAENGKCTDIPYANKIPPRAKIERMLVQEKMGLIFMWYCPEKSEPYFEIPTMPEWDDVNWTHWEPETITIKTHQREIIDNIADKAHFDPVHGSIVKSFENIFDGHNATQNMAGGHKTLAEEGVTLSSSATYHGPGYLLTFLQGYFDSYMLVAHTPISQTEVRVWYGLMVKAGEKPGPEMIEGAKAYTIAGRDAFFQDVVIWENKATLDKPMLCAGDGQILLARKWYKQFYMSVK